MREGQKREFARGLRSGGTDAERMLWRHLRNRGLMGNKFRRQRPVGRYIVDFICLEAGLVVELDGGQHASSAADAVRTRTLQQQGYRVVRFWNNEVMTQTDAVLAAILDAMSARVPEESLLGG